jgi:endoglucanase
MSTHGLCWYPGYINAGAMKSIRDAGGNVIRAAMYTQPEGGYLSEPQRNLDLMAQAIENARAMDLYILVDWHILDDGDPNANLDAAITFFDAVASRYPGEPAILYEICNEPNGVEWSAIQQYAYAICPVIRQYSPDAVIVLGTPFYSAALNAPMEEPFPRENILYAFHWYAGEHGDYNALEKALTAGLPVMVSEWGVGRGTGGGPALDKGRKFVNYLNKNGVSWCAWSLCNKDEVYSALRPDCQKLSQWSDEDLTEVGKLLFAAMKGNDT